MHSNKGLAANGLGWGDGWEGWKVEAPRAQHSLTGICDMLPTLDDPAQQTLILWVASPWHSSTVEPCDDSWCPR